MCDIKVVKCACISPKSPALGSSVVGEHGINRSQHGLAVEAVLKPIVVAQRPN